MSSDEFILRLPEPHAQVLLTNPRLEDADIIPSILNDPRVYPWLGAGLPFPHQRADALGWLIKVKEDCDRGQEDVRGVTRTSGEIPAGSIRGCPVRSIREVLDGTEIYLGDCGVTRWTFQDVDDIGLRKQYVRENGTKCIGDPTIIWTIGYYLKPSHHGKGIMKAVINTLVKWALENMNVRHIRTTAMEGNEASVKILEQNGFVIKKTMPKSALKAGVRVGLHVLQWKAAT